MRLCAILCSQRHAQLLLMTLPFQKNVVKLELPCHSMKNFATEGIILLMPAVPALRTFSCSSVAVDVFLVFS